MTPLTLEGEQLLRTARFLGSLQKAGPAPIATVNRHERRAVAVWLRRVIHNCKTTIQFAHLEKRKHDSREEYETVSALAEAERIAMVTLRLAQKVYGRSILKRIRVMNAREIQISAVGKKYDSLGSSIGKIFLVMDPDLALRAEKAL